MNMEHGDIWIFALDEFHMARARKVVQSSVAQAHAVYWHCAVCESKPLKHFLVHFACAGLSP